MKIPKLNKNINFYDFQYQDGYFIKTTSFIKQKNKPNIPYDFSLSIEYCKCCDVVKRISFTKNNITYIWIDNIEYSDKSIVNFEIDSKKIIYCNKDEILHILKTEKIIGE